MIRWRRVSPTIFLTAAVLVLLPLLALLQYHWLSQIGEESRTRMRAVAASAAMAMSADLAFEVGRAWRERASAEDTAPARSGSAPLVLDALVIDRVEGRPAAPRVRRWDLDAGTCEPAEWPERYAGMRAEAERPPGPSAAASHHFVESLQRRSTALGIVPIELPEVSGSRAVGRPPCETAGPAVVVFRLDVGVLRQSLLPEVARRHLDALQRDDFRVAIVSGPARNEVIYASPGADAAALVERPDVAVPLTFVASDRSGRGGRGRGALDDAVPSPPARDARAAGGRGPRGEADEGWLLVAQHRAGSLEGAVTRLRARNLVVSFGVLLLMGVAVAMIASNARKAERLGRQQVEFVAAVSHEMRTPVAAIDLAARNLEDGVVAEPGRVQRYGAVIRTEARRLGETVERVLQFAALEAGRGVGPVVNVDLGPLVDDLVGRLRAQHPEGTFELDIEAGPHVVRGDPQALRSAVQNLLGNAMKYGGAPAWARVRLARAGGHVPEVFVTVEDSGPGIDAHDVRHVFEPFYRGRLATERRVPGNGLGLHIVKRSIEALGGRVSVQTGRGTGTAITLHLPLQPAASVEHAELTTPPAGRG